MRGFKHWTVGKGNKDIYNMFYILMSGARRWTVSLKTSMRLLFILTILLTAGPSLGQTRTITGKVIAEYEMMTIPGVKIQYRDTIQLGTTDMNGEFKVELPSGIDQLLISFIGMEWTSIKVPADCHYLELIIMADVIYDFVTMETVNRRRYRRYKNIKKTHREAFDKGLFKSKEPCVTYIYSKH